MELIKRLGKRLSKNVIRRYWKTGFYTQYAMAIAFGVSRRNINYIINNKIWVKQI